MRIIKNLILGLMLLAGILLYWLSYNLSPTRVQPAIVAVVTSNSPTDIRSKYTPNETGQYHILAIGKFKSEDKNVSVGQGAGNAIVITNVSVSDREDVIATSNGSLYLLPDEELRRTVVLDFAAHSGTEYEIAVKLENIARTGADGQIDLVISPDPHEYKEGIISSTLLRILSGVIIIILLIVGAKHLVQRGKV